MGDNLFDNQGSITGPVGIGDHVEVNNVQVILGDHAKAAFDGNTGIFATGGAAPVSLAGPGHAPHDGHGHHHHWPGDHGSSAGGLLEHMQSDDGHDDGGGLFG
ncbi:hypothetical protein ACFQV2_37660 [Actinokineospora soli]|uniref:Uncharacterized protein n=1 Tax=Actinokineospora soli TaxID=1048753 RepID=A0ABW2U0I5_9PSEU